MATEPTPKDTIQRDGTAQLYRFRQSKVDGPVVLLVPSLINRWYVLDLHDKASLAQAFVDAGYDTYCLDWGIPNDEDRYLSWEDVLDRLGRAVRKVRRVTKQDKIGLLGYCMGATLSGIYTAMHPEQIEAFVNLAGPFDFAHAGMLGTMTDPQWFDPETIAQAGNIAPSQMQSGFVSMRPTSQIGKWVSFADRADNPDFRKAFKALDTWAGDNIPFPAKAYVTYIEDLYQDNLLVQGKHFVGGERVDLANIDCPVLTIATSRDHICPPKAAQGLHDAVRVVDKEMVTVKGGHVGAVVGSRAATTLYPMITDWFKTRVERTEPQSNRIQLVTDPPEEKAAPKNGAAKSKSTRSKSTKSKTSSPADKGAN